MRSFWILSAVFAAFLLGIQAQAQEFRTPEELPDFLDNADTAPTQAANDKPATHGAANDKPATHGAANDKPATHGATVIRINQPFSSKSLGDLTLPFMWEASENEERKRLVAVEVSDVPAVLTIDLLQIESTADGQKVAESVIQALAEVMEATATVARETRPVECGKPPCAPLQIVKGTWNGHEDGVARRCAAELLPSRSALLVLTLCIEASKPYSPDLPQLLDEVLAGMK